MFALQDQGAKTIDPTLLKEVTNRLERGGLHVELHSDQTLEVVVTTARTAACDVTAVWVVVRLRDQVSLKRDTALDLRDHPVVIWETADRRLVATDHLEVDVKAMVLLQVDHFVDSVKRVALPRRTDGRSA
jgi:hypothetical protein